MPQNRQNFPPNRGRNGGAYPQNPTPQSPRPPHPPMQGQNEGMRPSPPHRSAQPPAARKQRAVPRVRKPKKSAQKRRNSTWRFRLSVFAVCFVLFAAITAAVFFSVLYQQDKPADDYTLIIGEEKIAVPGDLVCREGQYFVNFSRVAQMLKMTAVGTSDAVRFVLEADSGYTDMRVVDGAGSVMINDRNIMLGASAVIQDGAAWLPITFLTEQMNGVYYHINTEKRTVAVSLTPFDEKGKPTAQPAESASFKVTASVPLSPLETTEPLDTDADDTTVATANTDNTTVATAASQTP